MYPELRRLDGLPRSGNPDDGCLWRGRVPLLLAAMLLGLLNSADGQDRRDPSQVAYELAQQLGTDLDTVGSKVDRALSQTLTQLARAQKKTSTSKGLVNDFVAKGGLTSLYVHRQWLHSKSFSAQQLTDAYTRIAVILDDDHELYAVALHCLATSYYRLAFEAGEDKAKRHQLLAIHYERDALSRNPHLWPAYAYLVDLLPRHQKQDLARQALSFLLGTLPTCDRSVQWFAKVREKELRETGPIIVAQAPASGRRMASRKKAVYKELEPVFRLISFFHRIRTHGPKQPSNPVPWRLALAYDLWHQKRAEDAIACCQSLIRLDPGMAEPYELLAAIYRDTQQQHLAAEQSYRMGLFKAQRRAFPQR